MKSIKFSYWIPTAILALGFLGGGIADLTHAPNIVEEMTALGFPSYVMTILGVWKVLAAIALVVPGFPQLKEWAYAGIAFDLIGATTSHLMAGSPIDKAIIPLVFLAIAFVSWALRPESRRLPKTFAFSGVGATAPAPQVAAP